MKYPEYVEGTQRAAELVQAGQYDEALEILNRLLGGDISDIDKSIMCLNIAVVYDKLNASDRALEWHDRGIVYERPYARSFVALHKAGYLATQGREILGVWPWLLLSTAFVVIGTALGTRWLRGMPAPAFRQ